MNQVALIDSGGANIASVRFALERLGASAKLTSDADEIRGSECVLLPGVGAARDAMTRLARSGLVDLIRDLTQPVLGICLGMQLLCDGSEEDNVECLGVFPGVAGMLPGSPENPVPNMGWCRTRALGQHPILKDIEDGSFFYYVHSFAIPVSAATIAQADHVKPFSAILARDNFVAAQFHPERSSRDGAQFLQNFLDMSK